MTSLWSWFAIAAAGALHGLNPLSGWMWAAGWGSRSRVLARPRWTLALIALGHAAAMSVTAAAVVFGLSMDRSMLLMLVGGLLCLIVIAHVACHVSGWNHAPLGHAELALWTFMMSTLHGAGLMLVPALMPLCAGNGSSREAGLQESLGLALAAMAVHTAAMLAVTAVMAASLHRGLAAGKHLWPYLRARLRARRSPAR
ncbi:MAG: hypothetical protein LBE61_03315 [Burkholderiaceae bacterium]|jgi:hypothetical protein|nr:hypothetical protein [Burkholderiaceae bacterium]